MDRLWAPWRHAYAATPKAEPEPAGEKPCFLCHGLAAGNDREHLIVYRTQHSCVVLNKFPYNNGHLLVAPLAHLPTLAALPEAVVLDLQRVLVKMTGILERSMKAEGFNIGLNLGAAAGAGGASRVASRGLMRALLSTGGSCRACRWPVAPAPRAAPRALTPPMPRPWRWPSV